MYLFPGWLSLLFVPELGKAAEEQAVIFLMRTVSLYFINYFLC